MGDVPTTDDWAERLAVAEAMIPIIGGLHRQHRVALFLHGQPLLDRSPVELLKAHRSTRRLDGVESHPVETLDLLVALRAIAPGPAAIDVAKLAALHRERGGAEPVREFVERELADIACGGGEGRGRDRDVVLYGFGRIGRIVARLLLEQAGGPAGLALRAVVVRRTDDADLDKRASLLRRDSIHGRFRGTITVDHAARTIVANGTRIRFIEAEDPAAIDYTAYGIEDAIVVDNTGKRRDEAGLSAHLAAPGVSRVLLTAPGSGTVKNVVQGVNESTLGETDRIVAAASCTTNAITPVLQAIDDEWGVEAGHVETVHSYTNDQNLTDNFHRGDRRGRAAALNMVLTETGAAKAVAKALPQLAGRLTGNAIRVPTADVSLAVLHLTLGRETTRDEVNRHLRGMALDSPLQQQIDYTESKEVASSDFVGARRAGVVDGVATIAHGRTVVLYVWYDNEWGYSCQVVRLLEHLAHGALPAYPLRESAREPQPV